MTDILDNQIALITGASRGIGKAIAITLSQAGVHVLLSARTSKLLDETAETIRRAGGKADTLPCDLVDETQILNLVNTITTRFKQLDILINNAGITHSGPLEQTANDDWDRCLNVNARAPFILCRETLPLLRQSPRPTIINIASVVGVKGYASQSAYTASKHALRGMSISLANELKQDNIRVHVLCPGGVETDMVSAVRPDIPPSELISPPEIAEIVLFLLKNRGNAVIDEFRIRRDASSPWF